MKVREKYGNITSIPSLHLFLTEWEERVQSSQTDRCELVGLWKCTDKAHSLHRLSISDWASLLPAIMIWSEERVTFWRESRLWEAHTSRTFWEAQELVLAHQGPQDYPKVATCKKTNLFFFVRLSTTTHIQTHKYSDNNGNRDTCLSASIGIYITTSK